VASGEKKERRVKEKRYKVKCFRFKGDGSIEERSLAPLGNTKTAGDFVAKTQVQRRPVGQPKEPKFEIREVP